MDFNAVITTDQYPKDAHDEDTKKLSEQVSFWIEKLAILTGFDLYFERSFTQPEGRCERFNIYYCFDNFALIGEVSSLRSARNCRKLIDGFAYVLSIRMGLPLRVSYTPYAPDWIHVASKVDPYKVVGRKRKKS
ncbi:hypothetical protein [Paramuribaculum intestinale]|uniref:hypothetical protein n=1 Tax=Paramuribaculum intestinale TaxID=2094151 RepID=UPI0025B6A25E|nr:hypothetical protein [Paramuribaculum intestinale]